MKLIGNLKNQVENAKSKEEAKGIIEKAGMSLTMDELEMVTGGGSVHPGAQDAPLGLDQTFTRYDRFECADVMASR